MSQSKRMSMIETLANVLIGYIVAVSSQLVIFPLFGIHASFTDNLVMGLWFMVISIIRGYLLRRAFNAIRQH